MKAILSVCAALAMGAMVAAEAPTYRALTEIPVGGDGGWDYLSVDPAAHRLYVSHSTHVVVIDTARNAVAGDIAGTDGVHGLAVAADLGRGFTSNGRENTVSVVDLKTLETLRKVETGETPDAILYEPGRHEVYAFNARGQSATVIDGARAEVSATIPLGGKPESGAADAAAGRVYVNIEDRNTIAVIDTATHKVVDTWPIAPGAEATGMAIDVDRHRLFVGCHNGLMLMIDSTSGKVVASVKIDEGVDATWYDPATHLAFSSTRAGTVTIARADTPESMAVVQVLKTAVGSRTMALDTRTHRIYLGAAEFEPAKAAAGAAANARENRPQQKPDSFKVLVFEQSR